MTTALKRIEVASGPDMDRVAKQLATERGLKQRSHHGHGTSMGFRLLGLVTHDDCGVEVVRVVAIPYR